MAMGETREPLRSRGRVDKKNITHCRSITARERVKSSSIDQVQDWGMGYGSSATNSSYFLRGAFRCCCERNSGKHIT